MRKATPRQSEEGRQELLTLSRFGSLEFSSTRSRKNKEDNRRGNRRIDGVN